MSVTWVMLSPCEGCEDGTHHGLGALRELVDALRHSVGVFHRLAPDGGASVCRGDVVPTAFEGHCQGCEAMDVEAFDDELGSWVEGFLKPLSLFMWLEGDGEKEQQIRPKTMPMAVEEPGLLSLRMTLTMSACVPRRTPLK